MRMVRVTFISIVVLGILSLSPSLGSAEEHEWKLMGKGITDTQFYIDEKTVVCSPDNKVRGLVKSIPEKRQERLPEAPSPKDILKDIQSTYFGEYAYTEGVWEIDCVENMFRLLQFIAYKEDDEVIYTQSTPDAAWEHILPSSAGEIIRNYLCK